MSQVAQYTVMGNPIEHSLSPMIHTMFAQQTGENMVYTATHVPINAFGAALRQFVAAGGQGANITLPFKKQAYDKVHVHTERAEMAKAVNTIKVEADGRLLGDNTDGIGFINDVKQNQDEQLEGQRILILGAGGAVFGIVSALIEEHPLEVIIMNRNIDRAHALVAEFKSMNIKLGVAKWGEADFAGFDMIIHATASGVKGTELILPTGLNLKNTWCYDLSFGPAAFGFLRWSRNQNARKAVDGLGMLVEQAAASFYLWRNIRPDTQAVLSVLRSGEKP